jgi:4-hydroxy-tetrahydrodipicolinate synthase
MPGFFAAAGKKPAFVAMMPNLPATIALGGHGVLAPDPNIIPRLSASTHAAFKKGDSATAMPQFAKILRLGAALSKYRNPRSQKAALNVMGMAGGYPRSPMHALDKRALDELEIAKFEGVG